MPILRRETEIDPETIFALGTPWVVAHVRSRQEKALARYARERGIAFYLPQVEKTRERSGRRFVSWLPIFPGYFFFRGSGRERDLIVRSGVVASLIDVADQAHFNGELQQIRELQRAGATFEPVADYAAGDDVRITSGPFAGYAGRVERGTRGDRLIVSIALVRKSVAVELPAAVLKRDRRG